MLSSELVIDCSKDFGGGYVLTSSDITTYSSIIINPECQLKIQGVLEFDGPITNDGTLYIDGIFTLNNKIVGHGNVYIKTDGILTVNGSINVGIMHCDGNATFCESADTIEIKSLTNCGVFKILSDSPAKINCCLINKGILEGKYQIEGRANVELCKQTTENKPTITFSASKDKEINVSIPTFKADEDNMLVPDISQISSSYTFDGLNEYITCELYSLILYDISKSPYNSPQYTLKQKILLSNEKFEPIDTINFNIVNDIGVIEIRSPSITINGNISNCHVLFVNTVYKFTINGKIECNVLKMMKKCKVNGSGKIKVRDKLCIVDGISISDPINIGPDCEISYITEQSYD